MIEIRKGQAPAQLTRAEFSARFRAAFIDPAFRAEEQSIARLEEIAWQAYSRGPQGPLHAEGGPGLCRSGLRAVDRVDRHQTAHRRGATALGRPGEPVARVADLRLGAQRRHLPGRDVQDLPAAGARARNAGAGRHRDRCARPEPAHLRIRPHISIPARAACRPRCRCATGRAAATPTTRSTRPTTGWPRSTSAGPPPMR